MEQATKTIIISSLFLAAMLLGAGCTASHPSLFQITKNSTNSTEQGGYLTIGNGVQSPPKNEAPQKNQTMPSLPSLPDVPSSGAAQNASLKLVSMSLKDGATGVSASGATALLWKGNEGFSQRYTLEIGQAVELGDGAKLELASLNDNWAQGSVWATFVINGTRRSVNVGQSSEAGDWNIRTMDLFYPPEKVSATFLLADFGGQKELNVTIGSKIYASGGKIYEVKELVSGYTGNYSYATLSEGRAEYRFSPGDAKPLPLGQDN